MSAREAEERVEILARALRWYADAGNWGQDDWGVAGVVAHPDYGQPGNKARRALKRAGLPLIREGR